MTPIVEQSEETTHKGGLAPADKSEGGHAGDDAPEGADPAPDGIRKPAL